LYLIATPIGNLEDMTQRAVTTLRRVTFIVAEDTRETRKLCDLLSISGEGKRFSSYGNHNDHRGPDALVENILNHAESALVTDRGTPGISDPGADVVDAARRAGVKIVPIPGASSLTAALSVSGFPSDRFLFLGFVARSGSAREETWTMIERCGTTAVFFESPKRIRETATELKMRFPRAAFFFARELTKMHESLSWFDADALDPDSLSELGEYVVALRVPPVVIAEADQGVLVQTAVTLRLAPDKTWAKTIGPELGVTAKTLYDELQKQRRDAAKAPAE